MWSALTIVVVILLLWFADVSWWTFFVCVIIATVLVPFIEGQTNRYIS